MEEIDPTNIKIKSLKLEDVKDYHILRILKLFNNNRTHAARALGINLRTLRYNLSRIFAKYRNDLRPYFAPKIKNKKQEMNQNEDH